MSMIIAQTPKTYFGSDIQKSLGSLPGFPWAKYPREKHLPGHNYTGPGTRHRFNRCQHFISRRIFKPSQAVGDTTKLCDKYPMIQNCRYRFRKWKCRRTSVLEKDKICDVYLPILLGAVVTLDP
ncbi:hypothetical protein LOTGIDRAFT_170535 [Lottia gigantea]|uniref:Uncharacterized protein n=1 Tax=Lottia gigantea TaxID=225164 RepID=V4B350_LOTGI|nr:hypothetical protein LOTGIDRAFT_170535 [Lottia gigantea]ESP04698.1 hypothetical protein LOTGIDRAFT_170535 [Lottia gigantea]